MSAESLRLRRGSLESWLPALGRAMARINAAANGPGVYDALAQGLVEELSIAMAAVWVFDPAADALNLRATAGIPGYHERAPSNLSPRDLSSTIVRVAMTGESEVVDEIGPGHGFKDPVWLRREGIRAYAGLPLLLGDQGCGAMSVFCREAWPPGLLDALRVLSQQAALAIEHARLIEESQTLQAIAAEVAATRDPDELLTGLVRRVRVALGADACGVWLLDERRGTLPIAASDGFSKRFLRIITLPEGDSISPMFDEIRETGRPLYTRDDQAAARARNAEFAAVFASEGVVSALRLPIFQPGGGVVGLLGLYHRHERLYTESEVRAAQAFTNQIAVALHNARLAQKEREAQAIAKRQVDQLGALTRVTEQLLASSNVDTVVRVLAKAAVELSSATGAVVALVRPGERMLELATTYGDFQQWFDSFPATNLEIADLSRWATGKAIRTGQTVFIPDYLKESMERPVQVQSVAAGLRSLIAAPLRKGDALLGMIWVGHKSTGGLTAEHALLLDALAEQGALALEQARVMEESHTLQVIAAELASTRETSALLKGIAERSMAALSADGGSVWLLDDEQRRPILAAAAGLSPRFFDAVQAVMVEDAETGAALYEAARSRQEPGYFADDVGTVRGISERMAHEFAAEGIVSSLRLPLTDPTGVVIGMVVLHHRRERLYSESEIRLAQAFTDQIAVALHNARLAEKEREAQAAVQRQAERLTMLAEVTEELLASSEVGSVVRVVAASAVRLCSARAAVVALVRPGQRKLQKAVTHGDLAAWFDTFTETNLNEAYAMRTATVEAIEAGETLLISDYAAQALEQSPQQETAAAGVRSLVIAPLRKGDVLRGVLWVAATEAGALTEEDALLMRSLADQAALALEQARLIEESHALQVIAAEVASARDTTAMLDGIVQQTMTALSADGCAVWLADQERGQLQLAAMAGLSTRFQQRAQSIIEADEQMAATALRSVAAMTRPVYSADRVAEVRDASDEMAEALAEEGIAGTLRLPLFEPEGASVGMLALYHQRERLYSDEEVRLAQAFTDQIAVALHNARLAEKERAAQAIAKRQLERLQTITRITERLLAATEFSTVLRVVVEAAGRLCDASGAMVGLIDDEGKRLSAVAGEGEPRRYFEEFTTPTLDADFLACTATGQALAQRAPVVVEDYAAWPTRHWSQQETVSLGVRAFVVAPLLVGGMPIGALWVNDVKPRSFQPEDVALVQALADQAALAIQHARLVQRGQDAAVLEERTRLARDLHDSVTQSVFSLGMMARAAQTQHERGNDRLGGTLERIAVLSQDALREMRALLFELQPIALAEEGLAGALERLAEAVRTRLDLDVDFRGSDCTRLAAEVETAIFRIVQEALANAAKHAQATGIALSLEERDGYLHVCVEDNGVGFDPEAPVGESADGRRGGMGMRTMQERAAAAGVQIRIRSRPGEGTSVTIEAALPGEVAASA